MNANHLRIFIIAIVLWTIVIFSQRFINFETNICAIVVTSLVAALDAVLVSTFFVAILVIALIFILVFAQIMPFFVSFFDHFVRQMAKGAFEITKQHAALRHESAQQSGPITPLVSQGRGSTQLEQILVAIFCWAASILRAQSTTFISVRASHYGTDSTAATGHNGIRNDNTFSFKLTS